MNEELMKLMSDPEVMNSKDPFAAMAAKYFGVPEDKVTKEQRQKMKELTLRYRYL